MNQTKILQMKKGDKFEYFGKKYITESFEGIYKNSIGAVYADLYVKEIDPITGKGRGKRLLNVRIS